MIQKANIQDCKAIYHIEQTVFNNDTMAMSYHCIYYHLKQNELFKIIYDGVIVGYGLWLKRKNYYRLYSLAILPQYQGLSLSKEFLEYSFTTLQEKKFSLEVRASNEKAIALYEKFGFKKVKCLKNYYEDEDGYKMERVET